MIEHQSCNQLTNRKWMASVIVAVLLFAPMLAKVADKDTEESRSEASGDVLKELLNGSTGIRSVF